MVFSSQISLCVVLFITASDRVYCFVGEQTEQKDTPHCREVDHVSILAASVAIVVVIVHKQARMAVIVERAKGFSVTVDLHAVPRRRFSCVDACFYCCE